MNTFKKLTAANKVLVVIINTISCVFIFSLCLIIYGAFLGDIFGPPIGGIFAIAYMFLVFYFLFKLCKSVSSLVKSNQDKKVK